MTDTHNAKDRETINVFLIATKGVLENFNALVILMSLIAEYDIIKNKLSTELAQIIIEARSINSSDSKDVTLSKVQKMYDDLKRIDGKV